MRFIFCPFFTSWPHIYSDPSEAEIGKQYCKELLAAEPQHLSVDMTVEPWTVTRAEEKCESKSLVMYQTESTIFLEKPVVFERPVAKKIIDTMWDNRNARIPQTKQQKETLLSLVLGNPGIGKSMSIIPLLLRKALEAKTACIFLAYSASRMVYRFTLQNTGEYDCKAWNLDDPSLLKDVMGDYAKHHETVLLIDPSAYATDKFCFYPDRAIGCHQFFVPSGFNILNFVFSFKCPYFYFYFIIFLCLFINIVYFRAVQFFFFYVVCFLYLFVSATHAQVSQLRWTKKTTGSVLKHFLPLYSKAQCWALVHELKELERATEEVREIAFKEFHQRFFYCGGTPRVHMFNENDFEDWRKDQDHSLDRTGILEVTNPSKLHVTDSSKLIQVGMRTHRWLSDYVWLSFARKHYRSDINWEKFEEKVKHYVRGESPILYSNFKVINYGKSMVCGF